MKCGLDMFHEPAATVTVSGIGRGTKKVEDRLGDSLADAIGCLRLVAQSTDAGGSDGGMCKRLV